MEKIIKERLPTFDKKYILNKFDELDKLIKSGRKLEVEKALMETDKLIFFVLKLKRYKGNNTFVLIENMKKKDKGKKEMANTLLKLHRIRNSIVNDLDLELPYEIAFESYKSTKSFLKSELE